MNKLTSIALSLLATNLLVGCIGDNEVPDAPIAFPRTCAERAFAHPEATDGDYTLFVDGDETKPWRAYCADMGEDALEYLTVGDAGGGNTSMYRAGGQSPGTDVETRFDKLRIDPIKLTLDVNDVTFAVSTGSLTHLGGKTIESMPLGVAMSCGAGSAHGQLSVSDTPFIVVGSLQLAGNGAPTGFADPWQTNKVVEFGADGDCGWVAPTGFDPMSPTGASIALAYQK